MKANTIKLEEELLNELHSIRPKDTSLSAFVRSLLKQEVLRRRMIAAAEKYEQLMLSNPEAKNEMDEWEKADLSS